MQDLTIFTLVVLFIARKRHVLFLKISESLRSMTLPVFLRASALCITTFIASTALRAHFNLPYSTIHTRSSQTHFLLPGQSIFDRALSWDALQQNTAMMASGLDIFTAIGGCLILGKILSNGAEVLWIRRLNLIAIILCSVEIATHLEIIYMLITLPVQNNKLLSAILKYGLARTALLAASAVLIILRVLLLPWNMGYDLRPMKPDLNGNLRYTVDVTQARGTRFAPGREEKAR